MSGTQRREYILSKSSLVRAPGRNTTQPPDSHPPPPTQTVIHTSASCASTYGNTILFMSDISKQREEGVPVATVLICDSWRKRGYNFGLLSVVVVPPRTGTINSEKLESESGGIRSQYKRKFKVII